MRKFNAALSLYVIIAMGTFGHASEVSKYKPGDAYIMSVIWPAYLSVVFWREE